MSFAHEAHAEAVAAVEHWIKTSKQANSLPHASRTFFEDLRAQRNIAVWSRAHVEQIMPFRMQSLRLLLVIRAGVLFLPILLTWLALSQVIGPFSLYLQNQQPSANFLWFWQQNPGHSFATVWELGHVALTDAAVLAFLTALAMRITWWETTRAEEAEIVYAEMLAALERYFVSLREK